MKAHLSAREHFTSLVIPEAVREVFLPTMRSDQRQLANALLLQHTGRVQQLLHRIRGALVIASAVQLADIAERIERSLILGNAPKESMAHASHFLETLDATLSYLEAAEPNTAHVPLPTATVETAA